MKKLIFLISIAILASPICFGQNEIVLRQELSIFMPIVSKTWVGETKDPSGQITLHMVFRYEPMHDGKILKYFHETEELKNRNDGYFYYDPDKKEIAFLALNSNGNIAVGNVKEEEGKILKYGYAIFPDRKLEFRNTLEITPDGKLVDKYFRFENGEWQAGHSVTYSVTEFPKLTGPYLGQKPPGATPEIFAPGIVSKEGNQGELNISPDLNEIIYWERKPPDNLNTFIRIVRDMDQWKAPEILPFSRDYINNEPSLSPDGKKLFFVSNRPKKINGAPERTPDIWFVEKVAGKWGDPVNLGAPINSDGVEVQPFMSAEPCFYFCKPPAEIYCSKFSGGTWQEPVKLSEKINRGRVSSPRVSPDTACMIFHSNNAGGFGSYDLYISFRDASGDWTEARNMGPIINTAGDEGDATFSPDGKFIFFSRDGDIYWVSAKIIEELRSKK